MFECLILVPLRPTLYDRISRDSGVVHGPAQRAPPAVPKGPNPRPAEHNTGHRYIGSRDGTGAAVLPFARSVGTEGGDGRPAVGRPLYAGQHRLLLSAGLRWCRFRRLGGDWCGCRSG